VQGLLGTFNTTSGSEAMRLTGFEAIEFAEKEGYPLNKSEDHIDPAQSNLTVAEAEAIATENADLIWLEVSDEINYGEPRNMEPDR
jgi:hypothetical protein